MNLKKGGGALTFLLALLTAVGPLSTDMYLPSLPAISKALDTNTSMVQLTLSVFMIGFAVGQVFYGPLSDRFGRKPVLSIGLFIYVIGSLACYIATSIEYLIAARFLQAIGAAAAIVLARAIVRDLFGGAKAARLLSLMGALMGVVPLIAPVFGGFLQIYFGWRANFGVTSIVAAILLIAIIVLIPETLHNDNKRRWSFLGMITDFISLLKNRIYLRYLAAVCLSFAGLFSIISVSSFVFQEYYGLDEIGFGLSFSFCVAGYIIGTLASARLSHTRSIEHLVRLGTIWLGVSGAVMIGLSLHDHKIFWYALVPMFTSMIGIGLVMPQSMAGALTPFPHMAGTASSLLGFSQNITAAMTGAFAAWAIGFTPNGLVWIMGSLGMVNLGLSLVYKMKTAK